MRASTRRSRCGTSTRPTATSCRSACEPSRSPATLDSPRPYVFLCFCPALVSARRAPTHSSPCIAFAPQVSVIAAVENLSQLAVGLANGVVVLYRGDISRDRFTKPKILHKGQDPITGT